MSNEGKPLIKVEHVPPCTECERYNKRIQELEQRLARIRETADGRPCGCADCKFWEVL